MSTPLSSSTAHVVGPYEIGREIGKGSFAVVHRGVSHVTQPGSPGFGVKHVAIKIVNRKKLTTKLLENLEGEISIMRTIRHRHVVELLDCLSTDDRIYLVMPFCASGDLSHYIRAAPRQAAEAAAAAAAGRPGSTADLSATAKSGELVGASAFPHFEDGGINETVVRSFLQQLASAMEFMRDRNIVHRDIKPQNLLLQPPDENLLAAGHRVGIPQLKVADFGFARNLPTATLAETLCGSPLYMAPEILRYEKYDAKADLWSVGAVLYEMSVGKPPFRAQNHVELLRKIERGEDRIRFPDERSEGSLARERERREEMGDFTETKRAHTVSADIKALVRGLLRQKPMERMTFDGLFRCGVVEDVRREEDERAEGLRAAAEAASAQAARAEECNAAPSHAVLSPTSPRSITAQPAPASSAQALPAPPPPPIKRGFASRYVVDNVSTSPAAVPPAGSPSPPAQPAAAAAPVPALARDRTRAAQQPPRRRLSSNTTRVEPSSLEDDVLETPSSSVTHLPGAAAGADAVQSATAPAADSDSFLGREYVMVEKRSVEVNALADELAGGAARATPRSPPATLNRRPSRLSRLGSGLAAQLSPAAVGIPAGPTTYVPPVAMHSRAASIPSSAPKTGTPPPSAPFALPAGVARRPSFVRRSSLSSSNSPSPRISAPSPPAGASGSPSSPIDANTAPRSYGSMRGSNAAAGSALDASPSPPAQDLAAATAAASGVAWSAAGPTSSALARAISMASVRLFGVPSGMSLRGAAALVRSRSSRRAALIRSGEYPDAAEAGLLVTLEDFGQKSFVLCEFADSRLAAYFPTGPHQAGATTPELEGSVAVGGRSLGRSAGMGSPADDRPGAQARTSSSSSSVSAGMHTDENVHVTSGPAEVAAAEALLLYVKSLSFLQRGIDAVKIFLEARSRPGVPATASADVNDVVQWLRARFNDGYERADFARARCGEIPESAQHVDKLIFDKALEIARGAALDELENNRVGVSWDANRCLLAYETASSMLLALLDPGEEAMDVSDGAAATIEKFVKSINKRLSALQGRVGSQDAGSV